VILEEYSFSFTCRWRFPQSCRWRAGWEWGRCPTQWWGSPG